MSASALSGVSAGCRSPAERDHCCLRQPVSRWSADAALSPVSGVVRHAVVWLWAHQRSLECRRLDAALSPGRLDGPRATAGRCSARPRVALPDPSVPVIGTDSRTARQAAPVQKRRQAADTPKRCRAARSGPACRPSCGRSVP